MADGNSGMMFQEKKYQRFSYRLTPTDDNRMFAFQLYSGSEQDFHTA